MASRRDLVSFDPDHFAKQGSEGPRHPVGRFRAAYADGLWGGTESGSGPGSSHGQTSRLIAELPPLLRSLGVDVLLDLPCGDFHWMQHVDLGDIEYIGADLLPELIASNTSRFGAERRSFLRLDLTTDSLPRADVVLCRDCLVHLSFKDIAGALKNIRRSGSRYLLTTTFPEEGHNIDVETGDWRPLSLQKSPFLLGEPLLLLNEGCTEQAGAFSDKSLGLWAVDQMSPGA